MMKRLRYLAMLLSLVLVLMACQLVQQSREANCRTRQRSHRRQP